MTRYLILPAAVLALAACEPAAEAPEAPPTEPSAGAPVTPEPTPEPIPTPAAYVGAWAADPAWCENTTGPERPVRITATRFEGYENSCAIASIDQIADGYEAALTCTAEGSVSNERVRMAAAGQTLRLTWLNRDNAVVTLTKCTTLEDTPSG